ncbi:histidine phosphatase family protein [Dysgonomonas sp. 520]|nr:histidine phosphatase family protein [Dysgonomonas sp. 520]
MAGKLTFYIARHGKTLLNTLDRVQGWCDSPLTQEGIEVAQFLGKGLEDTMFRSAYCSDLRRTLQTTRVILDAKNQNDIPVMEMAGFREACFGSYESDFNHRMWTDISIYLQYVTIEKMYDAFLRKEITYREIMAAIVELDRLGTAESFEQVKERSIRALLDICQKEEAGGDGNILVVSHGMTILVLMFALEAENLIEGHLPNAAVCKVVYENGKFNVLSVGDLSYVNRGKEKLNK